LVLKNKFSYNQEKELLRFIDHFSTGHIWDRDPRSSLDTVKGQPKLVECLLYGMPHRFLLAIIHGIPLDRKGTNLLMLLISLIFVLRGSLPQLI
jgi:hypothetical protein